VYSIIINGTTVFSRVNKLPRIFPNVEVWASDNFYNAANVEIRNLVVKSLGKLSNPMRINILIFREETRKLKLHHVR